MNSLLNLRTAGILLLLAASAVAAPVTLTINSNGGSPYADAFGNSLLTGSIIRVGVFDVSQPANLALLQTSNDYLALDALFTPLAEGLAFAGDINQAGASGNQIIINDLFGAGDVFGQIENIDDGYLPTGTQLYTWVFNSAAPQTATQWGIFTATTGWGFPMNPGAEVLSTFEIDNVIRGTNTGTQFQLTPVPEPGSIALVLVGAGILFCRARRQDAMKPALS
ncbi:MAG: PEP-CTERM sorting domain-containing protein [Verrucomicrobiaceae bacterium]|nr:PEP-CTERM sorting domain-containing protein [Verrucomicrobiaceae bacterium]